jgi:hypothetical protein
MAETGLTLNPNVNRGLLSALLPATFFQDFQISSTEIICFFNEDIEKILPQVITFLDLLENVTEVQFYFEMETKTKGILKTYGTEKISFNEHLVFQEVICSKTNSEEV